MTTKYKEAGVDIDLGDKCSALAYNAAKTTFSSRKNLIGEPIKMDGGFTGLLDFGDFYLVQNNDGVGTKVQIGEYINKFDTLGYDLLAMVTDDAICIGAEVISISNTIDINKVNPNIIEPLMNGLAKACIEQKVVMPGGEIAELGGVVTGLIWNATAIGIVEKNKIINGSEIKEGDSIIGLKSAGFRSNGFSLVRYILREHFGEDWYNQKFDDMHTWGEITLTPSIIYHNALLNLIGRYKEERKYNFKGIAHITGGGIPGNLIRILKNKKLGAILDNLPQPHASMLTLQDMATIRDDEAYRAWNMGMGMAIVVDKKENEKILAALKKENLNCQIIGEVTNSGKIEILSQGYFEKGQSIIF